MLGRQEELDFCWRHMTNILEKDGVAKKARSLLDWRRVFSEAGMTLNETEEDDCSILDFAR